MPKGQLGHRRSQETGGGPLHEAQETGGGPLHEALQTPSINAVLQNCDGEVESERHSKRWLGRMAYPDPIVTIHRGGVVF